MQTLFQILLLKSNTSAVRSMNNRPALSFFTSIFWGLACTFLINYATGIHPAL